MSEVSTPVGPSLRDVNEAVTKLGETFKTVKDNQSSYEEKLSKMGGENRQAYEKSLKVIEDQEKANQENTKKYLEDLEKIRKESDKKEVAMTDRFKSIEESILLRNSSSNSSIPDEIKYKDCYDLFLNKVCGKPVEKDYLTLDPKYKVFTHGSVFKDLRTDINSGAGFLVPSFLETTVKRRIIEISDVRRLSTVKTRRVKTLDQAVEDTIPTSTMEGEGDTNKQSEGTWTKVTFTAKRDTFRSVVTIDQIEFSEPDILTELIDQAARAFRRGEGRLALKGTGNGQLQGILDDSAGVESIETETSLTLKLADITRLIGELTEGYSPVVTFTRRSWAILMAETASGSGQNQWVNNSQDGTNRISGIPYMIMQDIPNVSEGANAKVVLYGDFREGYQFTDAIGMRLVRDDLTLVDDAKVKFTWQRWLDAKVVQKDAFRILKLKA